MLTVNAFSGYWLEKIWIVWFLEFWTFWNGFLGSSAVSALKSAHRNSAWLQSASGNSQLCWGHCLPIHCPPVHVASSGRITANGVEDGETSALWWKVLSVSSTVWQEYCGWTAKLALVVTGQALSRSTAESQSPVQSGSVAGVISSHRGAWKRCGFLCQTALATLQIVSLWGQGSNTRAEMVTRCFSGATDQPVLHLCPASFLLPSTESVSYDLGQYQSIFWM